MSEQRDWIIPLDYPECDAAFRGTLLLPFGPFAISFTRRDETTGSCVYTLTLTDKAFKLPLGNIHLRDVGGHRTRARITPPVKHPEHTKALTIILQMFWLAHGREQKNLDHLPQITELSSEDLGSPTSVIQEDAILEVVDPKRGDSIDAWLDWRDEQIRIGGRRHALSLRNIAQKSGFKIDTLKKHSADRHRQQLDETAE